MQWKVTEYIYSTAVLYVLYFYIYATFKGKQYTFHSTALI